MTRALLSLIATLALFGITTSCYAADSTSNSPSGMGFYVSVHGDPAPSIYGLNLTYRPKVLKYVRFYAGVGGFSSDLYNGSATFLDWTFLPIIYGFTEIVSGGHAGHYRDWKPNYSLEGQAVLTEGGGAKFTIPAAWKWKDGSIAPVLGLNWSHQDPTGQPWGFQAPSSQLYYSAGLDIGSGTNVMHAGLGFNWCPNLPIASCGFYLDMGSYL